MQHIKFKKENLASTFHYFQETTIEVYYVLLQKYDEGG